jgi:hypothetical protein
VATVIASAVFLPRHLLPGAPVADKEIPQLAGAIAATCDASLRQPGVKPEWPWFPPHAAGKIFVGGI